MPLPTQHHCDNVNMSNQTKHTLETSIIIVLYIVQTVSAKDIR